MCAIILCALIAAIIFGGVGSLIGGQDSGLHVLLSGIGLLLGGWWGFQYVAERSQRERGGW